MWEPLQRYNALPGDARKLFRRAAILGPTIGLVLRFRGYRRTQDWLQRKLDLQTIVGPETRETSAQVEMTCRMVRAAERYAVARVTCLQESLLLWYLLQRQGIPAAIRIGVWKPEGKFEAHAWVELNGIALNQVDEQHRHYLPFDSDFPQPPSEQS